MVIMNKTICGIVLSVNDYRENDAIVKLLGDDDCRYSLIARGIRKISSKNIGSVQPFQYARFFIDYQEQRTMHSMKTADTLYSFRKLRENLYKQSIADVFCECMEKVELQEGSSRFFLAILKQLERSNQHYLIAALFFAHMNRELGIEPFVDGCASCGRENRLCAISLAQGGLVCQDCYRQNDHLYEKSELKSFRILCKAGLEHIELLEATQSWHYEHFLMVYRFFAEYSGISIRSIRFLTHLAKLNKELSEGI